jgi:hypothetical protein
MNDEMMQSNVVVSCSCEMSQNNLDECNITITINNFPVGLAERLDNKLRTAVVKSVQDTVTEIGGSARQVKGFTSEADKSRLQ